MRDSLRKYFASNQCHVNSMVLGMVWVFASMKVLGLWAPAHPAFLLLVIGPVVAWMSLTAGLHERYRKPDNESPTNT